jgi:hypothetical protein
MMHLALAYVLRLGLAVVPMARDNRPLAARGVHDASTDPEQIRAWWLQWPDANIAAAMGRGVFCIDVDTKNGRDGRATLAELEDENGKLPDTPKSRTPSGGAHLYFKTPDRKLTNRVDVLPGVDIRTVGGLATLPPSRKNGVAYTWTTHPTKVGFAEAPAWLLDLIIPSLPVAEVRKPVRLQTDGLSARYVAAAINAECAAVAETAPNTGRNQRLFVAAAKLGELVGAGLVGESVVQEALEAAAADCGLTRDDGRPSVLATIRSGLKRGVLQPRSVA